MLIRNIFFRELLNYNSSSLQTPINRVHIIQKVFYTSQNKTSAIKRGLYKTMKFDSPAFHALFTPELQRLRKLFADNGFELRMAGGAVRDLLMGLQPADIDFATDATPTQMREIFEREQIRMFHKKGEEHGTIACRINDKENFEITTLRIDVVCDGRRAEVQFTTDWELDAFRRDLTVNSLFLGLDGTVHDYTGGIEDVKKRRIAFVGDAVQRLQEDYLRILRYFRFFGRLAPSEEAHDQRNLDAIIKCRDGLKGVSGERIWTEFRKILVGRLASPVMRCMLETCHLGPLLALSDSDNDDRGVIGCITEFERVARANAPRGDDGPLALEPSTILATLFANSTYSNRFQQRCKCSNAERTLAEFIIDNRETAKANRADLRHFKHQMLDLVFINGNDLKEDARLKCVELLKYVEAEERIRIELAKWPIPVFPVNGVDLMDAKVQKGPRMRATLQHLFNIWKKSDLMMEKEELLGHLNDPEICQIEEENAKSPKAKKRKFIQKPKDGKS